MTTFRTNLLLIAGLVFVFPSFSFAQIANPECLLANYELNGNTLDGTLNSFDGVANGPVSTTGMSGANNAYYFDGVDDYIELNGNAQIIPTTVFTITCWAKMDGQGGGIQSNNQLFLQRHNVTGNTSAVGFKSENAAGNIEFAIRTDGNSAEVIQSPSPGYGTWNHYSAVCNDTNMILYLNGVQVATSPFSQAGGNLSNIDYVEIGRQFFNSSIQGAFYGSIDQLNIYDCALSAAEINNLVTSTEAEFEPLKLDYFPNPTTGMLYRSGDLPAGCVQKIVNVFGQEMVIVEDAAEIDLSSLAKGIYFVSVSDASGQLLATRRIVLQ